MVEDPLPRFTAYRIEEIIRYLTATKPWRAFLGRSNKQPLWSLDPLLIGCLVELASMIAGTTYIAGTPARGEGLAGRREGGMIPC